MVILILAVGGTPILDILSTDEMSSSMQFLGMMQINSQMNFSTNCA